MHKILLAFCLLSILEYHQPAQDDGPEEFKQLTMILVMLCSAESSVTSRDKHNSGAVVVLDSERTHTSD